VTSPSLRSKAYAARVKTYARRYTAHLHPRCARRTSLRASDSPDNPQHQLSPPKLRILIPCYTYNTISPSYTPLPGIMTALALRTSLILVVGPHAVCRCTISGAQADSEARIPGITMTALQDIFTKAVTSNPQTAQPKCPNQICDSHPDQIEQTTSVHFIPALTKENKHEVPKYKLSISLRPLCTHPLLPHKHTPRLTSETLPLSVP